MSANKLDTSEMPRPASVPRVLSRAALLWLAVGALLICGVLYLAAPSVAWIYHVQRAGRLLEIGLEWPTLHQADSLPQVRDNSALSAANTHIEAAIEWAPERDYAYRLLGQIAAARHQWQSAADAYREAAVRAPGNPLPWWEASLMYEQLNRAVEDAPSQA